MAGAAAENIFTLRVEGSITIPPENLELREGIDEIATFETLQSSKCLLATNHAQLETSNCEAVDMRNMHRIAATLLKGNQV